MLNTYPQLVRILPTRMRGKYEGDGLHVASMAEDFATRRGIPIGRGLERWIWREVGNMNKRYVEMTTTHQNLDKIGKNIAT